MPPAPSRVHDLLNPTSIAIVGASDNSDFTRGFLHNLEDWAGFTDHVHLVNPRRETAFGRPCHASIADVPEPVDHAAVVVSAQRLPDVLADCAAAGVHAATVVASGFNESADGADLARTVRDLCRAHDIAMVGPNCYGFANYAGASVSRWDFAAPPRPGRIAVTVQSGAIGSSVSDSAIVRGIRLRYLVSSGNELVTDTNDYFEYFLGRDDVDVLCAVLERIPEPDRFADIATRALRAGKPVVVQKLGRSAAASRVAVAHTGAMTGSARIVDAFLDDLGVITVASPEELMEVAGLLANRGWPGGNRVAFCGYSGGASEMFADQADGGPLVLEPFGEDTRAALAKVSGLPAEGIHNPLDMTPEAGQRFYREIMEVVAADPRIDILVSQGVVRRSGIPDVYQSWRADREGALFDTADAHGTYAAMLETGDIQPGIESFDHPPTHRAQYLLGHAGVRALGAVTEFAARRRRLLDDPPPSTVDVDTTLLPGPATTGALDEVTSKRLLGAYGIPTTADEVVTSAADAAAAADRIGYPVVLKVVSPQITHKSDVGGVALGLDTPDAVRAAHDAMRDAVARAAPQATVHGISVARQVGGGVEFLAGITSDPALGPMVVVGLGGTYVEVLGDIVLARPPLSRAGAEHLIGRLRGARLLDGVRGGPALDRAALADVLCRLGRLALDLRGRLVELDVNPLLVLPAGQGVCALDALAVLADGPEGADI